MPRGLDSKLMEMAKTQAFAVDASGNGTVNVTYREPFLKTPTLAVIPHEGDDGTYALSAETKAGFTLTLTGSRLRDDGTGTTIQVGYMAHQNL